MDPEFINKCIMEKKKPHNVIPSTQMDPFWGGGVICPLLQYDYDPTLAVKIVV